MKEWTKTKIRSTWHKLQPKEHHSVLEKRVRYAVIGALGFGLFIGANLFLYSLFLFIFVLPNPGDLKNMNLTESTLIMDREGNLLYAIHGEENRKSLDSIEDVSPWLIDATIAIEDDQFYKHWGIDIPALGRAVLSEIGIGSPRGGSTITQQFVKNTFLSSEQTYSRKLKEIILALGVELRFSKDDVLLMYLNAIPYGSNAYGIELAAERYFNKSAAELSLAESAILASIPKAPTRYSPYGNYRYSTLHIDLTEEVLGKRTIEGEQDLDAEEWTRGLIGKTYTLPDGSTFYLKGRSDLVVERMEELGMISSSEQEEALSEIQALAFVPYKDTIKAPHFVLWVKEMLETKYGAAVVEQGGLKVYTTLDPEYQAAAEDAVDERWKTLNDTYGANNAALVSVQPQTGQILAMVGSAGYFEEEEKVVQDGQVNMITSKRAPGSAMKPFVFAKAFESGYSPATVLYDVATDFGSGYKPKNFDGSFMGPVSIRTALGQSRNIPAIKAYFMAGMQEALIPFVQKLGLRSLNPNGDYGPSLALGVAEVTPLEMAEAYSVFANGGQHVPLTPILKIENAEGQVLEQWEAAKIKKEEVLNPEAAFLINDILSDPSVGLGPNVRVDSIDNAAKTGTSDKKMPDGSIRPNNNWIAAYTPTLVTIGWAGNADGTPLKANGESYSTIAPIWKAYIGKILGRLEPTVWERPAGIKDVAISKATGTLPGPDTPSDMIRTEVFASFAIPTTTDNSFQKVQIETITNRLATPYSPVRFVEEKAFRVHRSILADLWPNWQAGVDAWAATNGDEQPPKETADDIHNAITSANTPEINITSPSSLSEVPENVSSFEVEVDLLSTGNGIKDIEFSMNGIVQFHTTSSPYTGKVRLPVNATEGDVLEVSATVIDQYGYSDTNTVQIRVGKAEEALDDSSNEEPLAYRYFHKLYAWAGMNIF
jgi:membrane peptidoglycan carboxypeptidase